MEESPGWRVLAQPGAGASPAPNSQIWIAMQTAAPNHPSQEPNIDEVLAAYLEGVERGWAPDRQKLLACYPDLAEELQRFFANLDAIDPLTAPLRPLMAAPGPGETEVWDAVTGSASSSPRLPGY